MLTILAIAKHTAADCAMFNETSKKRVMEWAAKNPELEAKHGVKMVGGWTVPTEHLIVQVFEAPNFDAVQAYASEPDVINVASWNVVEYKVAMKLEDSMKSMQG